MIGPAILDNSTWSELQPPYLLRSHIHHLFASFWKSSADKMEALSIERPAIPYYAPAETLPAPLPTMHEILKTGVDLSWTPDVKVISVGEHFVVKYGPKVRLQEGENMLFVQQTTRIRIPTVYALFEHEGTSYIVMERVRGEPLASCWDNLDEDSRAKLTAQLRRYFDELRKVEPPGYYGGIWGQQVLDPCLTYRSSWDSEAQGSVVGSIDTEEEWVEQMLAVLEHTGPMPRGNKRDRWLPYCQAVLMKEYWPVFTHGDIHNGNVLLGEDGVVTVLDWEFSGWCPAWWEWCVSHMDRPLRGFTARLGEFLDEYPDELECVEAVRAGFTEE